MNVWLRISWLIFLATVANLLISRCHALQRGERSGPWTVGVMAAAFCL